VPVKSRDRGESKRRKRKGITTLGSSGSLCWWSGSSGGGCVPGSLLALGLYLLGACSHSFPKVVKMSWWAWGSFGGLTTPSRNAGRCLAQVLNFLAYVASQRERGQGAMGTN